jgi:HEAT repeat protein
VKFSHWCLAIGLGFLAAIIFINFPRSIFITETGFDLLPEGDKESLVRSLESARTARSGRILLHAAVDASPQVRQTTTYILRSRCDLADGLIALLEAKRGYSAGLMTALGGCGAQQAIPVLITYLADLSHPGPAGVAAEAIEKLGAREAIPQLIRAVRGCDPLCSARAASALSSFGEAQVSQEWAAMTLAKPEPTKIDTRSLPDWMFRQYAVRIFGRIGTTADIPTLLAVKSGGSVMSEEVKKAVLAIQQREGNQ